VATSAEHNTQLVNAWVPKDLAERLDEAAKAADRSRSAELRVALRRHLARMAADPEAER
jgi:predicted transcriptional regulator